MNDSPIDPRRIGIKITAFLAVALIVWIARPLFHPLLYRIMYSPGTLYAIGLPMLAGAVLYFAPPLTTDEYRSSAKNKMMLLSIVFVVGFVLAMTLGFYGGFLEERTLAEETMEDVEMIEDMPQVNENNPRIVPRAVADTQTRGSVSYRTHRLGKSDIARAPDGRLVWSYPIQPDQFNNRLNGYQRGVLLSDMTAIEDRQMTAYDEQQFKYGQGQVMHRSIKWKLLKEDYTTVYKDDPIEFVHDGEAYMAFPKTGHEWKLTPVPHTTPTWDGVALVHQDGTVDHLSPDEAQESEILDGQRLYPLYNAERKAESLKYREGITNTLPLIGSFENVVEPAGMPSGSDNSQPFVIDMEGQQMNYVMAMGPPGSDTRGLAEVWFFNADTGQPQAYSTGDNTLLGPERAVGIVRSKDSRTDWDTENTDGQFKVVEPIPVTVNSELWWHTKVTPTDDTDVTRNVFVNAHTGEAIEIETTEDIIEFLGGENASELDNASAVGDDTDVDVEPAPDDENVEVYIVIYDSEGTEIDRIPIEPGQEIQIEQANDE